MADGVDAGVDSVQPANRDPVPDRPSAEPERQQLPDSDDPVLPGGKGSHFPPTWMTYCTHTVQKVIQVGIPPP